MNRHLYCLRGLLHSTCSGSVIYCAKSIQEVCFQGELHCPICSVVSAVTACRELDTARFILCRTRHWDWQLYTILEVVHHRRTRDAVMNTLFWKHCFWHRPSILIMSGTCASAACKERVIYEDWPILSHIMCCCARANTGVTGGALSHVIKWPGLITGSSACKIKQFPVSLIHTQKKKLNKYLFLHRYL